MLLDFFVKRYWCGRRRWERSQLAKAVTKMLGGGEPKALASAPTLLKALALLPDGQERGVHPHHFALPLDAEAKSLLGAPTGPMLARVCARVACAHFLLGTDVTQHLTIPISRPAPAGGENVTLLHSGAYQCQL